MGMVLAAGAGFLFLALAAAAGQVDAPTYTNTVGPAFIASVATLVTAIALLVRAIAAFRKAGVKLDATAADAAKAAKAAAEAADQVNGKMASRDAEITRLRELLDAAHTKDAQQRRTIEVLLERDRAR